MTNPSKNSSVAFIGLGVMGSPIAGRMGERLERVVGFDISPAAREAVASRGVLPATSIAEAVKGAGCIFMMLPKVEIARQVTLEVLRHASKGALLVELGTIGSDAACEHAVWARASGVRYLDAPVINGGEKGARDGTLKILAGGDVQDVEDATPSLRTFSTETFHLGAVGTGQSMKLIHNTLLAALSCAYAEALVLADKAGVSAQRALDILKVGSTRSFALDWLFTPAVQGDFSGGATVNILLKDMLLGMKEVDRFHAPAGMAARATDLYQACQDQGLGHLDMSAVYKLLRESKVVSPA